MSSSTPIAAPTTPSHPTPTNIDFSCIPRMINWVGRDVVGPMMTAESLGFALIVIGFLGTIGVLSIGGGWGAALIIIGFIPYLIPKLKEIPCVIPMAQVIAKTENKHS